jgi:hypothetical protein
VSSRMTGHFGHTPRVSKHRDTSASAELLWLHRLTFLCAVLAVAFPNEEVTQFRLSVVFK